MCTKLKGKYMWAHFVVSFKKELDHHQTPYNEQILKCYIFIFNFLWISDIHGDFHFNSYLLKMECSKWAHFNLCVYEIWLSSVLPYIIFISYFFLIFYHNFPLQQLFNLLISSGSFLPHYLSSYYFFYVDSTRNKCNSYILKYRLIPFPYRQ